LDVLVYGRVAFCGLNADGTHFTSPRNGLDSILGGVWFGVNCRRRWLHHRQRRFDEEVVAMGVLDCHLRGDDDPRVLTDVGAFWLSQLDGPS